METSTAKEVGKARKRSFRAFAFALADFETLRDFREIFTVDSMSTVIAVAVILILARWVTELCLTCLNEHHVRSHADTVPESLQGILDEPTYQKSVGYTLAKSRFGKISDAFDLVLLLVILFSGCYRKRSIAGRCSLVSPSGPWQPSSSPWVLP